MSNVPVDDSLVHASLDMPTLEECIDEHDDIEVSVPFTNAAFSSSLTPSRDTSKSWIVYSACSINLTAFRGDFVSFEQPWGSSRIGYVGVGVMGSGTIEIEIEIVYNMYRMRRFYTKSRMRRLLSLGPPNYAIQGTYKSGLDRKPPKSNLSKGIRGFYSPPGRVHYEARAACI
jgi:hypothetical protein